MLPSPSINYDHVISLKSPEQQLNGVSKVKKVLSVSSLKTQALFSFGKWLWYKSDNDTDTLLYCIGKLCIISFILLCIIIFTSAVVESRKYIQSNIVLVACRSIYNIYIYISYLQIKILTTYNEVRSVVLQSSTSTNHIIKRIHNNNVHPSIHYL